MRRQINKKSNKQYILQAIRKSRISPEYMAGYSNSVFRTLQNYDITIHIGGACWGRNGTKKTVTELIDKVFNNVKPNIKIKLYNYYKSSHQRDTLQALLAAGHTNIYSYGDIKASPLSGVHFDCTDKHDHAKFVAVTLKSDILFFMIGSSNFSHNTYIKKDANTDQLDLSFISCVKETDNIVQTILNNSTNQAMREINFENDNGIRTNNAISTPFDDYYRHHKNDFITTPFICSEDYDLLEDFFAEEIDFLNRDDK
ncbi:hypothetical protein [Leuconostoc mesenteroides]|uniref:hypothetical protein n=1 Tax=Leuconostoc mesenteroides TaxID=1245 RepID=UPI00123BF4E1|nr:hypothetical protein [Leuconostoc mesenteroides]KAA8346855.1 hypothetical protein FE418_09110 [Leuconostoc mesenteroides]